MSKTVNNERRVRCYDNGGKTTVVFTGRYRHMTGPPIGACNKARAAIAKAKGQP